MPLAFVLGGGGTKGDFEVGALRYLVDSGFEADILCGTSVGSINAIKLAEGRDGMVGLETIWLERMQNNNSMYLPEQWLSDIEDLRIRNLIEQYLKLNSRQKGDYIAKGIIDRQVFAPKVILDIVDDILDLAAVVDAVKRVQVARSAYNLMPIRDLLYDPDILDLGKIIASGIKIRLIMVGLSSGRLRYVDEAGRLFDRDGTQLAGDIDLREAVVASASEPVIFPPVMIGGEACVDGGIRDVVPMRSAVAAGATTIFAISASESLLSVADSFEDANLLDIGVRSILDVVFDEMIENDLSLPANWGGSVTIIRPTLRTHDGLTIDPGLIRIWMAYGYMVAADETAVFADDGRRRGRELADAITTLRQEIWIIEVEANGQIAPGEMAPIPEALDRVREMKWRLFEMASERVRLGGAIPSDAMVWWKNWERHPWEPYIDTPWDRFISIAGERPAADPPPGDLPILAVPLDMSFLAPLLLSGEEDPPPTGLSAAMTALLV
jgi:predicted acylesterase/phospholipase RssA